MFDKNIQQNNALKIAGLILFVYGIVEIGQCIGSILMAYEIIPNLVVKTQELLFPGWESKWYTTPISYISVIIMFTLLRLPSGIGILKNKLYGFWFGIIGSLLTIFITVTVLQINVFMLPFHMIIIILLIYGNFKERIIVE